jgi:hypothetical protein
MAVADNLAEARAALTMVQAEPSNAEAPPEALTYDVTPTHTLRAHATDAAGNAQPNIPP